MTIKVEFEPVLNNSCWKSCWVCGNPLVQGRGYSYVNSDKMNAYETHNNIGINLYNNNRYAVCCSDECINMAVIALA